MASPRAGSVLETGAPRGAILVGIDDTNEGIRIQVEDEQTRQGGQVIGSFLLLFEGTGKYAIALRAFVGDKFSSAKELIDEIKPGEAKTLQILNRNNLKVEQ